MKTPFQILFICRDNASRSLMAEHIVRSIAADEFESHSAGAYPAEAPHPLAVRVMKRHFETDLSGVRPKSWDEFRDRELDFIITLSEHDLEGAPVWRGSPVLAHWTEPDPAQAQGTEEEQEQAFWRTAEEIARRIRVFTSLPEEKLESLHASAAVAAGATS